MSRTPRNTLFSPRFNRIFHLSCILVALLSLSDVSLSQQDTSLSNLKHNFQNPPEDAKPMMRWWWFGPAVTIPELNKELETMHEAGIGGVEIQPVYPLMLDDPSKGIRNLPYLSPEFLDAVRAANIKARSLNMRVSITLGSGWPYGGPQTTLNLSAGRLRVVATPASASPLTAPQLTAGESLIATFETSGTPLSYDAAAAVQLPNPQREAQITPKSRENHVLLFFIASHTKQTVKRPSFGAEGLVLDHFSTAAIDEHLTDVATPLLSAFGDQPPYSVFSDSLEVYNSDWTKDLPAQFLKRRGYDLLPHLPEIAAGSTPEAASVRHDWGQTLSDLIRENYLQPITHFASDHNTLFRSQTYGLPAVTLADEAVPNLPEGEGPQWKDFSFTRWASSASHLYGRNVTSAETWTWLHSPAFRATPLDMKVEADRMFLIGVNQFVGHGWPYSPPGAGEPGWSLYAAAVFNSHNPWFPVMPYVDRYLQRISYLLRQGEPVNDVAILLPEDDAQAAFTPGHVSVTDEMKKHITPEFMASVLDAGYNVDYIDAATIDKVGIHYPILILPSTDRIPLATYKKIATYSQSKGHVIALQKLPTQAPGLMDQHENPAIANLSHRLTTGPNPAILLLPSTSALPRALHQFLPPDLEIQGSAPTIGFIHRKLPNEDIYFLANTGNTPVATTIQFRSKRLSTELFNPDLGTSTPVAPGPITLALAPYESRVYILSEEKTQSPPKPATAPKLVADLSESWQITLPQVPPQELPSLVSWTTLPNARYFSGQAVYTAAVTLTTKPATNARLLLDFGTGVPLTDTRTPNAPGVSALLDQPVCEAALIYVNGQLAGPLWHPPYRLDITTLLKPGQNSLEVRVFNTAINELAGQPPRDYTALNAKFGKRFDPQDMDNLQPIPSGLLGPIHLLSEEVLP